MRGVDTSECSVMSGKRNKIHIKQHIISEMLSFHSSD